MDGCLWRQQETRWAFVCKTNKGSVSTPSLSLHQTLPLTPFSDGVALSVTLTGLIQECAMVFCSVNPLVPSLELKFYGSLIEPTSVYMWLWFSDSSRVYWLRLRGGTLQLTSTKNECLRYIDPGTATKRRCRCKHGKQNSPILLLARHGDSREETVWREDEVRSHAGRMTRWTSWKEAFLASWLSSLSQSV